MQINIALLVQKLHPFLKGWILSFGLFSSGRVGNKLGYSVLLNKLVVGHTERSAA